MDRSDRISADQFASKETPRVFVRGTGALVVLSALWRVADAVRDCWIPRVTQFTWGETPMMREIFPELATESAGFTSLVVNPNWKSAPTFGRGCHAAFRRKSCGPTPP